MLPLLTAADTEPAREDDLFDLTLNELLEITVTSVSKRPEPLSTAAAAVFVITSEDIARAGITTIPEALRLAPGMEVAQIDGNKWAVSARGYNGRFSNKLLVLIDGRAVYSPVFSGVFWDVQDVLIEDIERIEVIRGPGAALWGANAVNGIVNVVTRSAHDTQGGLLSLGAGNQETGFVGGRWGGSIGDMAAYRVYAKYFDRNENRLAAGGDASDRWYQSRVGVRIDAEPTAEDRLFLAVEHFEGNSAETSTEFSFEPPYEQSVARGQRVRGYNVNVSWNHDLSATESFRLQAFADSIDREWGIANIDRATQDASLQVNSTRFARQDIVAGAGYRINRSKLYPGSSGRAAAIPPDREEEVINFFAQDQITLVPERLRLTLGSKFEYNDYTGWEVQPSVRASWQLAEESSVWMAVSRAVRTPTPADLDYNLLVDVLPPPVPRTPPIAIFALGNKNAQAEDLVAYEAGFRLHPSDSAFIDLAAYYNRYDNIRSARIGAPSCLPSGAPVPACLGDPETVAIALPTPQENDGHANTFGFEALAEWRPEDWLRLQASYSFFEGEEDPAEQLPSTISAGRFLVTSPRHQASLRAGFSAGREWQADLWLRYVGEVLSFDGVRVPDYVIADARVAKTIGSSLELSFVAKNLFNDGQAQFLSEPTDVPLTEIRRSLFLQLRVAF